MPVSHTTTRVLHMVLPMATVHTHMVRWSARVPIVERFLGVFLGVLRRFYHAGAPNTPKRGPESLPMGPRFLPEPARGALAPTWATPTHMGARVGW
jgi:hypothetical protein